MTYVAGWRADEARDLERLRQLVAVDPRELYPVTEEPQGLRQRLDRGGLAGSRWAKEQDSRGSRRSRLGKLEQTTRAMRSRATSSPSMTRAR